MCILGIFTISAFNVFGITVTQKVNALARSIADVTRTVVVWLFGLILTWSTKPPGEHQTDW